MQCVPDAMAWMRAGIPLTLVMDLLTAEGPRSDRIVGAERPSAAEMSWLTGLREPPAHTLGPGVFVIS